LQASATVRARRSISALVHNFNNIFSIGHLYRADGILLPCLRKYLNVGGNRYAALQHKLHFKMNLSSSILKIFFSCVTVIYCGHTAAQNYSLKSAADQWQKTMDLKNAELITTFFDTTMVAIYHSNPVVYGKEANLKIWQHQFDDSLDQHPITIEKVDVSSCGDMGYVYGKWWSIHPTENYYTGGRFVSVWSFKNKEWRILMLSVNVQDDVKSEKKSK